MSSDTEHGSDHGVYRIDREDIALEAKRYKNLFVWVRKYTDSDICAWLIVQDLNQAFRDVRNRRFEQTGRETLRQRSSELEDDSFTNAQEKYVVPVRIP
jgi:hypothetical protein